MYTRRINSFTEGWIDDDKVDVGEPIYNFSVQI